MSERTKEQVKAYDMAWDTIEVVLCEMSEAAAVAVWNAFCIDNNRPDDIIYNMMEEFDGVLEGEEPLDLARRMFYGHHFCPADKWFMFNGYANLESTDYPQNDWIYEGEITDWLLSEKIDPEDVLPGMTDEDVRDMIIEAALW